MNQEAKTGLNPGQGEAIFKQMQQLAEHAKLNEKDSISANSELTDNKGSSDTTEVKTPTKEEQIAALEQEIATLEAAVPIDEVAITDKKTELETLKSATGGGRRRSKRRQPKRSAKQSKKGGRSRKNRRKHSRRRKH